MMGKIITIIWIILSVDYGIYSAFSTQGKHVFFPQISIELKLENRFKYFCSLKKYILFASEKKQHIIFKSMKPVKSFRYFNSRLSWLSAAVLLVFFILMIVLVHNYPNQLQSFSIFKRSDKNLTHPDSLKKAIYDSLFNAGHTILYSNPDSSRLLVTKAMEIFNDTETKEYIRALNLLGASYSLQSNFSQALDVYKTTLEIAVRIADTAAIANIYNNIGIANMKIGNYNEALEYLLKAMNYYDAMEAGVNKYKTISNIGLLYMEIDNYEKSLFHFSESLQGYRQFSDSLAIANVLTNMGIVISKLHTVDSAFYYFDQAISINERIGNEYGLSVVYAGKATVSMSIKDPKMATHYYEQSLEHAEKLNHINQKTMAILGLAAAYLSNGDTRKAFENGQQAMKLAEESNNDKLLLEAHKVIAEIYKETHQYDKALEHYQSFVQTEKDLISQNKLHQIYNLEIDYLNQTKAIQQLQIQQQELLISRKNSIIIFIIIAFLLIMAGAYLFYLYINNKRTVAHQHTILQLSERNSRAAIQAEIQERRRIGRELHDGLGQMLSSIRLIVSALKKRSILTEERKDELIDAAIKSVDDAFSELRDISHNLAHSELTEKGLNGALKELALQVNQSGHIKMKFESYGLNGKMDTLVENTLYRAAQELLTNTVKYAQASNFFLHLVKSESEITMMVEDDGKGFCTEKTLSFQGSGINNIRSRVENLNGQVYIDSMENRGTIVTIVIPIKKT